MEKPGIGGTLEKKGQFSFLRCSRKREELGRKEMGL